MKAIVHPVGSPKDQVDVACFVSHSTLAERLTNQRCRKRLSSYRISPLRGTLLILTIRYDIVDLPEYVRSSRIGCQLHIQYTTLPPQGNSFHRTGSSELVVEKN